MKTCTKCGKPKEDNEFWKKYSYCIECAKIINRQNYEKNKEGMLAQQKEYRQTSIGKEVARKSVIKYRQTPKGKTALLRAQRKYRASKACLDYSEEIEELKKLNPYL